VTTKQRAATAKQRAVAAKQRAEVTKHSAESENQHSSGVKIGGWTRFFGFTLEIAVTRTFSIGIAGLTEDQVALHKK
jgi:hypothetical protein